MYLVSLYFDEKTNQKINTIMKGVADSSGNSDMIDKGVPPHITLTAFESVEKEDVLINILDKVLSGYTSGELIWVSGAAFFPHVLFLTPVLNEYLCRLSQSVCDELATCNNTRIQDCYKTYHWLPHTTVARKLTEGQMTDAFAALQKLFVPFEGTVVRIGLSKATPKKELKYWDLRICEKEEIG